MLICVPLTVDALESLRRETLTDVAAHAATPALFDGVGLEPSMEEDAEFVALTYASVASLLAGDRRCVAIASHAGFVDGGDDFGRGSVPSLELRQVTSLYIDEPEVDALVAAARTAVAGASLPEAWEDDAVQALLAEADLLWHDVEEIDLVLAQLRR